MRFLLVLIGIVVLVFAAAVMTGFVKFDQTKGAVVQAPEYKMNVGKVDLGTENKTVAVPTISVQKPDNATAPAQ